MGAAFVHKGNVAAHQVNVKMVSGTFGLLFKEFALAIMTQHPTYLIIMLFISHYYL